MEEYTNINFLSQTEITHLTPPYPHTPKKYDLSHHHLGDTKASICLQQDIKKILPLLPQKISYHHLPITKHSAK